MTMLIDLVSIRLDRGTTFKKRALGGVGDGGLWRHAPPVYTVCSLCLDPVQVVT